MGKVLVVYCSMSGNTKAAAEAVSAGARDAGAMLQPPSASRRTNTALPLLGANEP